MLPDFILYIIYILYYFIFILSILSSVVPVNVISSAGFKSACSVSFRTAKIKSQILFLIKSLCKSAFPTGINQFNTMAMQNAQMSQASMGARTPSPMNHPQQMNMNAVSTVRHFIS